MSACVNRSTPKNILSELRSKQQSRCNRFQRFIQSSDRESRVSVNYRYDRIDEIEKREWQIGECRDTEGYRHISAASIPWHERRRQRSRIFDDTRQIFLVEIPFLKFRLIQFSWQDDRDILIGCYDVYTYTAKHNRQNQ